MVRSILAFIVFCALLVTGIMNGGQFWSFIDIPSVLITVGGGLTLTLINFSFGDLFGAIGMGFGGSEISVEDGRKASRALGALGSSLIGAGVIGTMIGLVNMGTAIDDYASAGPGVATAIITTFYALVLNYAVVAPLRRSIVNRTSAS